MEEVSEEGRQPTVPSVAVSANRCLKSFQKCLLQAAPIHPRELSRVENQKARFSTWAMGMGVFAPEKASMDHRLRYATEVQTVVCGLLKSLDYRIRICVDVLGGINIDLSIDPPILSSRSLEQAFGDMAMEISRLNKISNTIRSACKEVQLLKAADFRIEDEDGNDVESSLLGHFERHIRDRFPDASEEIQRRLARTMLLRRKRILYRRDRHSSIATRPEERDTLPTSQLQTTSLKFDSKQGKFQPVATAMGRSPSSHVQSATTLNADAFNTAASTPSVISTSKTVALGNHEALCFPPAPGYDTKRKYQALKARHEASMKLLNEPRQSEDSSIVSLEMELDEIRTTEITCPYCISALPSMNVFDQQEWETHVKNDLDPYVCLFEYCERPDELYTRSETWLAHLNQHNQRWHCSSHRGSSFSTRNDYIQHLRTVHRSKLTDAQLRVLANKSLRKAVKLFHFCPLCQRQDDDIKGRLEDHIAGHLRYLALKSLPSYEEITGNDEPGNDSVDVSRPCSRGTIKDLQYVDLVGSDANHTLDDLKKVCNQDEHSDKNFFGTPHPALVPESHPWTINWTSSDEFVRSSDFASVEDDPILQSILRRQTGTIMTLDDMPKEDKVVGETFFNESAIKDEHKFMLPVVHPEGPDVLLQLIDESRFLRRRDEVIDVDFLAELRRDGNHLVLIDDRGQQLLSRQVSDQDPTTWTVASQEIVGQAEQLARAHRLLNLPYNEDEMLEHDIYVTLGTMKDEKPDRIIEADGRGIITEGEHIYIGLTNNGTNTVYVYTFDINVSGKIALISTVELPAQKAYYIGAGQFVAHPRGRGLPISWPRDISKAASVPENIILILTDSRVDLGILATGSRGQEHTGRSTLEQLCFSITAGMQSDLDGENVQVPLCFDILKIPFTIESSEVA